MVSIMKQFMFNACKRQRNYLIGKIMFILDVFLLIDYI